jgi:ATP-dependent RNA helicase SUPV3L1/SUV3
MAEKLFRAAHEQRAKAPQGKELRGFAVDTSLATSMGLLPESFRSLMKDAGFRPGHPVELAEGSFGPPRPVPWTWRAPRKDFAPARGERGPRKSGPKGKGGKPHKGAPPRRPPEPKGDGGQAFAGLADLLKKG